MMIGTETLYIKKNGRYVEVGMHCDIDMYPGIWLVQKDKNSTSMKSLCISELPEVGSLVEVVQARLIAQIIMKELEPMWRNQDIMLYNIAFAELEHIIADAITKHVNKGRKEAIRGGYDDAKASGMRLAQQTFDVMEDPENRNSKWAGFKSSKIEIVLNEISDVAHRKVGTHEFAWYIGELRRLMKANGYDINDCTIGGFIVNPDEDDD